MTQSKHGNPIVVGLAGFGITTLVDNIGLADLDWA